MEHKEFSTKLVRIGPNCSSCVGITENCCGNPYLLGQLAGEPERRRQALTDAEREEPFGYKPVSLDYDRQLDDTTRALDKAVQECRGWNKKDEEPGLMISFEESMVVKDARKILKKAREADL